MRLNINEKIRVELTPLGEKILSESDQAVYHQKGPCYAPYYTFQVWDFMRIFGSHLYNGADQIVRKNEIIIGEA